jgi:hypothetical protein
MKALSFKTLTNKIFLGIITILIVFLFDSCSTNYKFLNSSMVPAARGTVKIKRDHNKNYIIQLKLFNLAEVKRLQTSKQTYIVWMVTDREITKNIGQLNSSTKLFSKMLKGSFKTVSPFKPTKIFITSENDPSTQYPDMQTILTTDIFKH